MSLTTVVKDEPVRDRIDEVFPKPDVRATSDVQAPWQTQNYTLIGTAFDYLLRFYLRYHSEAAQNAGSWVAENGLQATRMYYPDAVPDVEGVLERAESEVQAFMESGELTRDLVECALDLARVDVVYRSGRAPENLGEYAEGDIVDCIKLWELLGESGALQGDSVVLNPAFGPGSRMVGGADADVILDGVRILLDERYSKNEYAGDELSDQEKREFKRVPLTNFTPEFAVLDNKPEE